MGYPTSIATFTTKSIGDTIQPAHVNALQTEITAIETALINGFAQTLLPIADATYDLGSLTKQWKDLYLSGTVVAGGEVQAGSTVRGTDAFFSAGIITLGGSNRQVRVAAGSPEGVTADPVGSMVVRTDGGLGTTFYKKISGSGDTGWLVEGAAQTQTFAAGDYTATGGGTWTVESGDVVANTYRLIGNTLLWNCYVKTTTFAGTVTSLQVKVPGSYTCQDDARPAGVFVADGAGVPASYIVTAAGSTLVTIATTGGTNYVAGTNVCIVGFQIAMKVS